MSKTITAREAAAILGVSAATLYSYVSRGLLVSSGDSGTRAKRYAHDDVLRLAARRGDGKRAGHAVAAAMNWGVPVLETRIAHIDGGRLYYRGTDACVLAEHASLEQAAALLWQRDAMSAPGIDADAALAGITASAGPDGDASALRASASRLAPLPRAMALLPLAGPELDGDPLALLRLTASLLLNTGISDTPLHLQAARAWGLDAAQADMLRAAMVVLADHELNNSAFTARCVASSGAALPLVLCAALAALSGPEHGGHYTQVKALLQREAAAPGSVAVTPMTAGFGHPLYERGDIRASYLMARLHQHNAPACAPYTVLAARAAATPQAQPNSDFALAALELVLELPDGAALALLAMARTAGWIAHALEQRGDGNVQSHCGSSDALAAPARGGLAGQGTLIRPRARYVGDFGAT